MLEAFSAFDRSASSVIKPFLHSLGERPAPPLLYHYTNSSGMRGVLESGALWMTDMFKLNDPSELGHGMAHVVSALKSQPSQHVHMLQRFTEMVDDFYQHWGVQEPIRVNVCSFSDVGDDLGQWRAYADQGRGFALGFEGQALENEFIAGRPGKRHCFGMSYDEKQLKGMLTQVVRSAMPLLDEAAAQGLQGEPLDDYLRAVAIPLTVNALHLSVAFKHAAYSSEREYRFMQFQSLDTPLEGARHRVRGRDVVSYLTFEWRTRLPHALKEIVIGPAADRDAARAFVDRTITELRIDPPPLVRYSIIPFRG